MTDFTGSSLENPGIHSEKTSEAVQANRTISIEPDIAARQSTSSPWANAQIRYIK